MFARCRIAFRLCFLLALLTCGCSVIRVEPGKGPSLTAALRASMPGDTTLSVRTWQELYRLDLHRHYPDSLGELAARLHAFAVHDPRPELLFALAEINHLRGRILERDRDRRATLCYFRSAGYCYHYLFGPQGVAGNERSGFDPRFRLACDLYNTALARCLELAMNWQQLDPRGSWVLPGRDDQDAPVPLKVAHVGFDWKPEEFSALVPCSVYKITGVPIMQRTHGVGVPMVAQYAPTSRERPFVAPCTTFAVTAFCRFVGPLDDLIENPNACLELLDPLHAESIVIGKRSTPLEADFTTPLACHLGHAHYVEATYLSFLRPSVLGDRAGLHFLTPYRPGQIPVVFVHGLLSSPQTWLATINELLGDPEIRKRYCFGVFFYPTGEPYLATAADLRRDLKRYRESVDPRGKDAGLSRTVLVGHSMGGLISRLLTVDGGDDLWRASSPYASHAKEPEGEPLPHLYYFERDPNVSRVVFQATPHLGSSMSPSRVGRFASALAGIPRHLLEKTMRAGSFFHPSRSELPTSIDLLSPESGALQVLASRPIARGVKYHSVIGVSVQESCLDPLLRSDGYSGDSVVTCDSARLLGASSEVTVESHHHYVHQHPRAIAEVRRVLLEHLAGR